MHHRALEGSGALKGPTHARSSRLACALAALVSVLAARGQDPKPTAPFTLTRVEQIRNLSFAQAKLHYPVRVRAIVTYWDPESPDLFIQDSTGGIWVETTGTTLALEPGELIELEGISAEGDFAPQVEKPSMHTLGRVPMPATRIVSYDQMISSSQDSQWVEVDGIVRSAMLQGRQLILDIATNGHRFKAHIPRFTRPVPAQLVDAAVRLRGVSRIIFNNKRQVTGVRLNVPALDYVLVDQLRPADPFVLPVRPINSLLVFDPRVESGHRVRVEGVVTLAHADGSLYIQDQTQGLLVEAHRLDPTIRPTDWVEAVGFPTVGEHTPVLQDATVRRLAGGSPATAVRIGAEPARRGEYDAELVEVDARLINRVFQTGLQALTLLSGDWVFRAEMEQKGGRDSLAWLRVGSKVRLTGVCTIEVDENRNPQFFRLLLRSPQDIVVLQQANWWTVGRALLMVGLTALVILAALGWAGTLQRRVKSQTETIRATLESTADGILVVDELGKIVVFNQKFVEMWRLPKSVLSLRDYKQVLGVVSSQLENPDAFLAKVREVCRNPKVQTEDLIKFKDGRVFERHSEPQRVGDRSLGRVWGFRDVTQRNRAEEALQRSEEQVRLLLSSTAEAIYSIDLEGNCIVCNPACARLLGYQRPEDLHGQNMHTLAHHTRPDGSPYPVAECQIFQAFLQGKGIHITDEVLWRADGTSFAAEYWSYPLRQGQEVVGAVVTFLDITERKRAGEATLQAREAAEAASRPKREFLANMSH